MMSTTSPELWLAVVSAAVVVIAGFSVFARWVINSNAVPEEKLHSLRVGMSIAEVKAALGEPRQKRAGPKGQDYWIYGSRLKRHLLIVEFTSSGKMSEFVHGVPQIKRPKHKGEE